MCFPFSFFFLIILLLFLCIDFTLVNLFLSSRRYQQALSKVMATEQPEMWTEWCASYEFYLLIKEESRKQEVT